MYVCKECNFSTYKKSDYKIHLGTAKHLMKFGTERQAFDKLYNNKKIYIKGKNNSQSIDTKMMVTKSILDNHDTDDSQEIVEQIEYYFDDAAEISSKIKAEKNMIRNKEDLTFTYKQIDDENKNIDDRLLKAKKYIEFMTDIFNRSVLPSDYLNKYHNKTPVLKKISSDKIQHLLNHRVGESNELIKLNIPVSYFTDMIEKHLFVAYIGKLIIHEYKCENIKDQRFFSDNSRKAKFVVRTSMQNEKQWRDDNQGILISNLIVKPIMNEVMNIFKNEINTCDKVSKKAFFRFARILEYFGYLKDWMEHGDLCRLILHYISPFFYYKTSILEIALIYNIDLEDDKNIYNKNIYDEQIYDDESDDETDEDDLHYIKRDENIEDNKKQNDNKVKKKVAKRKINKKSS